MTVGGLFADVVEPLSVKSDQTTNTRCSAENVKLLMLKLWQRVFFILVSFSNKYLYHREIIQIWKKKIIKKSYIIKAKSNSTHPEWVGNNRLVNSSHRSIYGGPQGTVVMLNGKQKLCQQWEANKRTPKRWRISLSTFNRAAVLCVWWKVMSRIIVNFTALQQLCHDALFMCVYG